MRILLIEDDADLADGLQHNLRLSGYSVDIFHRGGEGVAAAKGIDYEAVILDLGLPDVDGLVALRALRQSRVAAPVIILTARDELSDRIEGLDAGADDYMVKPFAVGELEARLRAIRRRPKSAPSTCLRFGALFLDLARNEVTVAGRRADVTARELAVLRKLMERAGGIVSKDALFDATYGWNDDARPQAIEVYISRLRKRLEPAGVSIRSLRGLGYRLEQHDA